MNKPLILLSRLAEIVFRRTREDRLSSEIDHHIDLLTEEFVAKGRSPADARLAARKQFGNLDRTRMDHRDQRGFAWMDSLSQDVRFAFRMLTRERGFALTAIVVLGVGIGVNNMFFTLLYAHKFRGLPIARPDRVLSISAYDDRLPQRAISLEEFQDMRDSLTTFDALSAHTGGPVTVGDEGRAPDRADGAYVTAGAFESLGIRSLLGRLPPPEHDRPGAPPLAMLGATVWQSRYGGDRNIIGRTILINGSPATVVAIVPDRSGFPSNAGVWLPFGQWPGLQQKQTARSLQVFGRLSETATGADARKEIERVFSRLEIAHPETNRHVRPRLLPINERVFGDLSGWEAFIIAGLIVILVASANVANLMLARAMHRVPEIAIRTSLGASRMRIVRQLLVEAAVIAAASGAFAAAFSITGVRLFQSAIPEGTLPYWFHYEMDARVFAGLVVASIATIGVFGFIPALQASRTDVNRALKDGGRSAAGRSRAALWTTGFLTIELALAMILLSQIAVTSLRANDRIPTDAAIRTTAVMTSAVTLPAAAYPTSARRQDFFRRLDERLASRPEVTAVSRATVLPGSGGVALRRVDVEGRAPQQDEAPRFMVIEAAPSYLSTLALTHEQGRDFDATDGRTGADAVIVNQRFVETELNDRNPIGVRIAVSSPGAPRNAPSEWRTIVGVTPTIRQQGAGGVEQQTPTIYMPIAATEPATSFLMVRHTIDPQTAAQLLREEVRALDSNVALYQMSTLERAVDDAQWNGRLSSYLGYTVCFLSVLLAIVGLYAVTAQRVTLRTREIGLRMALGAPSMAVARLVLRDLRVPLVLGLLLGTIGAMAWDRAFSSSVRDVYAAAPETLGTIAALLIAIVLASCCLPLRKAVRMNPLSALRHD